MSKEHYEIKEGQLTRNRKFCPKCEGSFLADHEDRFSCGKCGFTEFKKK